MEDDAFDLRVTLLDGLRLAVDPIVLLANAGQHLRCDYRQFASAERLDILGCDGVYIEHEAIVQSENLIAY